MTELSERSCRRCGCTQHRACLDPPIGICCWVEPDLCSCCARWEADHPMTMKRALEINERLVTVWAICEDWPGKRMLPDLSEICAQDARLASDLASRHSERTEAGVTVTCHIAAPLSPRYLGIAAILNDQARLLRPLNMVTPEITSLFLGLPLRQAVLRA